MPYPRIISLCLLFIILPSQGLATPDKTQLAVWANEAIISTYTYSYQNFIERQKDIALYFTAKGWIAYSKAFQEAKLSETIQQNKYYVSSVATMPPTIKLLPNKQWQATMPILVIYKNPQYKQKQSLDITLTFTNALPGQGIRGLAITSLQAKLSTAPCQCRNDTPQKAIV